MKIKRIKVTLCKYPTVVCILCHIIYCICVRVVPSMFCLCVYQAQRDYFGAHTYELLSNPGTFVHTNWTGHGGSVSSSTYQA